MNKQVPLLTCVRCNKNIKITNYRIHLLYCNGSKNNFLEQNILKSQILMTKKLNQKKKQSKDEYFPCVHCSFRMTFKDFDTHPAVCTELPIQCPYCKIQFPKSLIQQHENYCQVKKINKGENYLKSKSLPNSPIVFQDEPTVDEHVEFLMRQLAHNFGMTKTKALTNKDLIDLHKSKFIKQDKNQQYSCSICDIQFNEGQNLVKLPCKHQYHRRCICHWFSVANTCPMCRYQVQKKK